MLPASDNGEKGFIMAGGFDGLSVSTLQSEVRVSARPKQQSGAGNSEFDQIFDQAKASHQLNRSDRKEKEAHAKGNGKVAAGETQTNTKEINRGTKKTKSAKPVSGTENEAAPARGAIDAEKGEFGSSKTNSAAAIDARNASDASDSSDVDITAASDKSDKQSESDSVSAVDADHNPLSNVALNVQANAPLAVAVQSNIASATEIKFDGSKADVALPAYARAAIRPVDGHADAYSTKSKTSEVTSDQTPTLPEADQHTKTSESAESSSGTQIAALHGDAAIPQDESSQSKVTIKDLTNSPVVSDELPNVIQKAKVDKPTGTSSLAITGQEGDLVPVDSAGRKSNGGQSQQNGNSNPQNPLAAIEAVGGAVAQATGGDGSSLKFPALDHEKTSDSITTLASQIGQASSSANGNQVQNNLPTVTVPQNPNQSDPALTSQRFADANHQNIIAGVRGNLLPGGGSMQIRLDPPELGALSVQIEMRDGQMNATFQTSNDDATKLLSHSLGQLKTALESQGVNVDKIQVQQSPKESFKQTSQDQAQQNQQQDQTHAKQEQQRKEMLQKMWNKLAGRDDLDLVA